MSIHNVSFQDARPQGRQSDLEHSYRLYKGLVIHGPHKGRMGQCDRFDERKMYWFTVMAMDEYNSILDFNNGPLQPFARNKGRPMSEELIMKSTMNSAGK